MNLIDLIEYVWKYEKFTIKCFLDLGKIFVMTWSLWTYRNNMIFRKHNVQPVHIINLVVKLFDEWNSIILFPVCVVRIVVHVSMLPVGRGEAQFFVGHHLLMVRLKSM